MLVSIAQAQLFLLVMTRILAILLQVPVFGSAMIPTQVKIALGVILSIIMVPWQPLPQGTVEMSVFPFAFAVLQELIIGFLAGFAATLTFGALQIAGKVIDLSSGFASGQIFNPTIGETASALDQLFLMIVMLFFLVINGHHDFLLAIQKTFSFAPVMKPLIDLTPTRLLETSAVLITTGVQIALPVFGALFMADLAFGLLARVAPQMNVFFLGLPVKILITMVGLGLLFTVIFPLIGRMFREMGLKVIGILGV